MITQLLYNHQTIIKEIQDATFYVIFKFSSCLKEKYKWSRIIHWHGKKERNGYSNSVRRTCAHMSILKSYAVNKYLLDHLEINSTYTNNNFFIPLSGNETTCNLNLDENWVEKNHKPQFAFNENKCKDCVKRSYWNKMAILFQGKYGFTLKSLVW